MSQQSTQSTLRYVGRPWRSRFLRAPMASVELTERPDFVPLGALADLSLGLKTGADGFFFVTLPGQPRGGDLGKPGARTLVAVEGKSWTGQLNAGDLRPALMNPHALQRAGVRRLLVPARTDRAYLAPQDRPPRAGLPDYIQAGERAQPPVNTRPLVRDNADGPRWWRSKRDVIDWRWALPYNSGYDYGAHDNEAQRVLNGRFVGVKPDAGLDPLLLGAVLNSTFTILTRLTEGVSTGSEGAYDVGPPAARLMSVPDLRRFTAAGAQGVLTAFEDLRQVNVIPSAPDRAGHVDPLRVALDRAILGALGVGAGDTAVLLDRVYAGYARWRAAVEDVEDRVQANRRDLAASGRSRTEKPADLVARQVWDELSSDAAILPADALDPGEQTEANSVARDWRPSDHEPMFDAGVIRAPNGTDTDLGSWNRARYAGALLRLGFDSPLLIPTDPAIAGQVVDRIETEQKRLDDAALKLAKERIGATQAREVTDAVLRSWRHRCHDGGQRGVANRRR
jgi:hypothetical protein